MSKGKKESQEIILIPTSEMGKRHDNFLKFIGDEGVYYNQFKPYERYIHKIKDNDLVIGFAQQRERISINKLHIYPEAVPFLFSLEGCPQKLLYYILLFEVDNKTGILVFNSSSINKFMDFCSLFNIKYKPSVIRQALKTLSSKNVILNLSRTEYQINPLITGDLTEYQRAKQVNDYCINLIDKGKSLDIIYPVNYNIV